MHFDIWLPRIKNLSHGSYTGNHAFNNARGLLFAGIICKLPFAKELAFEIFKERLPKLVTADGFLREGVHYHFLFTRWVLEIEGFCQINNKEIKNVIRPYAINFVKRCWFFLLKTKTEQWSILLLEIFHRFYTGVAVEYSLV